MVNKRSLQAKEREIRKKEEQRRNVEDCCRAFSVLPAYWGIDAYKINHISPTINMKQMNEIKQLHLKEVEIKYVGPEIRVGTASIPERITIKDEVVQSLSIYTRIKKNTGKHVSHASIQFVNTDHNNIILRSMEDVANQIEKAKEHIAERYGILLNLEKATFKTLELAFNIKSNIDITERVRQIVDECFMVRRGKFFVVGEYVYGGKHRAPIARKIETEGNGYKKRQFSCYNKIKQMQDQREIPRTFEDIMYRFELKLTADIKDYLGTDRIALITDESIADAIKIEIDDASKRYAKRFLNSVDFAEKIYRKDVIDSGSNKSKKTHNSANTMLQLMESMEITNKVADIIDVESFIYMHTHEPNQARDVKALINRIRKLSKSKKYEYMLHMDGWKVEEILKIMAGSLFDSDGNAIIGASQYEMSVELNALTKTTELHEFSLLDDSVYKDLIAMMQNKKRYRAFKEQVE